MNQRPRLAILASRFPYPLEKGDKLRLYYQIKYLSESYEIFLFSLSDHEVGEDHYREIKKYCTYIQVYTESNFQRKIRVVKGFFNKLPGQVNYFLSGKTREQLLSDLIMQNPDVIFCQLYRMVPYLDKVNAPKVLDIMDSFSTIADLQSQNARHWLERWFWKTETKLLKEFEAKIQDKFSQFTIISERDAGKIGHISSDKLEIIRNGIAVSYFNNYDSSVNRDTFDMAFIGNIEYRPNQEAVHFIQEKLWPYFKENNIELKILIGGKGAEKWKEKNTNPNIIFHGWYEDIREAYYSAKVFIAPLFLGSGMQNKVLEALACSRDVICSSHVIDAMPMLRNYVRTADTKEEYLKQYINLQETALPNSEQKLHLDVLKKELSWEIQCGKLKLIIDDARKNHQWNFDRYH
ncbi:glycosyltransferase [Membranihabitans marinus]|uniref:glycosyltransferase n=1 Tax=Membranihabitans marinus TaxID=1227546 RepID=UPI001F2FCE66|nr:glycosyltransferase [Membranihabitans marinus]